MVQVAVWLLSTFLLLALGLFAARRGARYLHFFQQEEYDGTRFARWWLFARAFDCRLTLCLGIYFIFYGIHLSTYDSESRSLLLLSIGAAFALMGFVWFMLPAIGLLALREENPTKGQKKPLVWTARAKRIFRTYMALAVVAAAIVAVPPVYYFVTGLEFGGPVYIGALILWVQLLPFLLVVANLLLKPFEKLEQRRYLNEAKAKLKHLSPTIIAITGSYGKTSAKHILGHILSSVTPTLMTPGSVNTMMGITRIIREQLKPEHKFFIVEMGAYGPGSIARLCKFTPPRYAAITAIGSAHYERFGSVDQVARAKFEIAEAAWQQGGNVVVNETQIDARYIEARASEGEILRVSDKITPGKYSFTDVVQTADGLSLTFTHKNGEAISVTTPLFGLHHAANIAVAAALASEVGVPLSAIQLALKNVPQTKHRLEVKRYPNQPVMIDDAYNSNPTGFAAALDVLDLVGRAQNGRRILITPGMAELGGLHEIEHRRLGQYAATRADWIIAVKADRIPSFVEGARVAGGTVHVDEVATLDEARALLNAQVLPDDVVLYENDLPDLYEAKPKF